MIWEKISSFGGTSQIKAWRTDLGQVKTESLNSKEIKPVNPKGNQPWIFIGRTDAEAEAPVLWPSEAMSQFTGGKTTTTTWERLKAKGEEGDRRWNGLIASLTQLTWEWKWKSLSSVRLFAIPWPIQSVEFSVPSPVDLPDPGIKPGSPALQVVYLPTELSRKPQLTWTWANSRR